MAFHPGLHFSIIKSPLGIWHCATVKPNINQVGLRGSSARPMHLPEQFHQHKVCADQECLHAGNALFISPPRISPAFLFLSFNSSIEPMHFSSSAILCSPYWQWCSPESRTAQVPVHHILKPVTKSSFPGGFWFPVDRFIQVPPFFL